MGDGWCMQNHSTHSMKNMRRAEKHFQIARHKHFTPLTRVLSAFKSLLRVLFVRGSVGGGGCGRGGGRGRGCGRIGEGRIFLLVGAIKKVKL